MSIPRKMKSREREHGLTLVELVIFIVIVSVAVVGILQVMSLTTRHSGDPQLRKQALSIAEALLEEVELAHFTFCDPADLSAETATSAVVGAGGCTSTLEAVGRSGESGTTRPYDNVNDYVDQFDTPLAYTQDAALNLISVTGAFNATVTIKPDAVLGPAVSPITPADGTPANMNALRITVIVTYNNGNDNVTLEGYRTRYAPRSVP